LQEKIEDYKEYMTSISRMCGYASEKEYQVAKEEYAIKYKAYSKMQEAVNKIKKDTQGLTSIYESEIIQIEPADAQKVEDKREIFRSEMEGVVKSELQDKYGNNFDEGKFGDACSIIDKRLKLAQSDINMKEQHRSKQSVKDDEKDKVAEHAVEKKHRIHR
jgi:hypothetical protein